MHKKHAIVPIRAENYPEWYQQIIKVADLAEVSPTRGCMVIKPWGYAIWELIQKNLDALIKESGHVNAYFPLLIPVSFFEKEAEHVKGFAKECAVVTHSRLEIDNFGKAIPSSPLRESYIIRPTSETIIGYFYSKWIKSYRDLPVLINQWANVMRWEMRPRMFLRTAEFLWQEGHTAHETEEEARIETIKILNLYADFAENYLAIPVVKGLKTVNERFPGAVETYCVEAMMQDGKALQIGTSHFLGQNFSKASNIIFTDKNNNKSYAWTTSWGVSTRLIGGLIMTHSDDDGLILPPKIAPIQIVILPIWNNSTDQHEVFEFCEKLMVLLNEKSIRCFFDKRDIRGGEKRWQYIKKGIPFLVEIGSKDLKLNQVTILRRDKIHEDKQILNFKAFIQNISNMLESMQDELFDKAKNFRDEKTKEIFSLSELDLFFANETGFALSYWNDHEIDKKYDLLLKHNVTPRCILIDEEYKKDIKRSGTCLFSGRSTEERIILAKSY